jgi:hypothetical protein
VSEEATTTTTETAAVETSQAPERPEWIDTKFWDADAGQPRVEDLAKSYREAQSLIGRRVSDMSVEARRKLAETIPDEMRATWGEEVKAKLVEDEDFLAPLREKWAADLPKAPEAYDFDSIELPDGLALDLENPLISEAAELAKGWGLSQERFAELVALGARLSPPPASLEDRMAAVGPDFVNRATAAVNRAKAAAGEDPKARAAVDAVLSELQSPEAFRGLEVLLSTRAERRMPDETAQAQPAVTLESLREIQARPEYTQRPDWQEQVRKGFTQLYGDTV